MLVENSDKLNYFITEAKVHGVRKPAKQGSSNVILDLRKLKRALYNSVNDGVELVEQRTTKPGALLLVPCSRIAHIDFNLGQDREASDHRSGLCFRSFARSSSRNSSQDLPLRGLR